MVPDLEGYLPARVDLPSDAELFQGLSPEVLSKDGKYKKLTASRKLLDKLRKLPRAFSRLG